jgi:hypothetical protein
VLMYDDAMNDDDAMFEDEVVELPASSVQELPLIKDCAGQLATIARVSLLPTPNNQPRSLALEQGGSNNA